MVGDLAFFSPTPEKERKQRESVETCDNCCCRTRARAHAHEKRFLGRLLRLRAGNIQGCLSRLTMDKYSAPRRGGQSAHTSYATLE